MSKGKDNLGNVQIKLVKFLYIVLLVYF